MMLGINIRNDIWTRIVQVNVWGERRYGGRKHATQKWQKTKVTTSYTKDSCQKWKITKTTWLLHEMIKVVGYSSFVSTKFSFVPNRDTAHIFVTDNHECNCSIASI